MIKGFSKGILLGWCVGVGLGTSISSSRRFWTIVTDSDLGTIRDSPLGASYQFQPTPFFRFSEELVLGDMSFRGTMWSMASTPTANVLIYLCHNISGPAIHQVLAGIGRLRQFFQRYEKRRPEVAKAETPGGGVESLGCC